MKTLEEFLKEIAASEELQNEMKEIRDNDAFEAFLKKNDCDFTAGEYVEYVKSQAEGVITDDDAEAAAGGGEHRYKSWIVYD